MREWHCVHQSILPQSLGTMQAGKAKTKYRLAMRALHEYCMPYQHAEITMGVGSSLRLIGDFRLTDWRISMHEENLVVAHEPYLQSHNLLLQTPTSILCTPSMRSLAGRGSWKVTSP